MTDALLKATYETYRAQIMLSGLAQSGKPRIDPGYYYAVSVRMFPYFHENWCDGPDPFVEVYKIKEESISSVIEHVDPLWKDGNTPDFYALENKFGSRSLLIDILRYCFLSGRFDSSFYEAILKEHPAEAKFINDKFNESDCFLL